ncbi:MAG TPA: response regulator transcription factor, partial [Polyangiaceae bacterium]|nr:response regulator transcription factor [Polyangiaceae bacterium]
MQNPPPKAHSDGALRRSVVVVEDDAAIAMGLRINLEKEGYDVRLAVDGEAALETIRGSKPDLVILDLMLPNMNGFEVLQTLRREGFGMPVIVLSARTGEIDKVTGLELGAEDYVAKPFSLAELLARVRAALRRAHGHHPAAMQTFVFGDVIIDIAAREVRRNGSVVEMTATEFDVLMCLVEARGKALTRDHIFHKVWGPKHHGTPRTIDNFIQQLRAKLELSPQEPKHFHTVRGVG